MPAPMPVIVIGVVPAVVPAPSGADGLAVAGVRAEASTFIEGVPPLGTGSLHPPAKAAIKTSLLTFIRLPYVMAAANRA